MPATQIEKGEWFYIREDIREISKSAQGSNPRLQSALMLAH